MCPNGHKAQNLDNLNYISFCVVIYFETVVNKNAPLGSLSGSTSSDELGFTYGHYTFNQFLHVTYAQHKIYMDRKLIITQTRTRTRLTAVRCRKICGLGGFWMPILDH